MKKIFNTQLGMSIIEILIAIGMLGGLGLVVSKLGQNQSQVQKSALESADINSFYNQIERNLMNHTSCKETFTTIGVLQKDNSKPITEIIVR